jgi:hypothetical protein
VRQDGLDGTADLVFGGHVSRHGETPDFRGNGVSGCAVAVEDGNRHTLARESARDLASDAATGASDQPDPPLQRVRHVTLLAGPRRASTASS